MVEVKGKIIQIVGPIVDVKFIDQALPNILTALSIDLGNDKILIIFHSHFSFQNNHKNPPKLLYNYLSY